MKQLALLLLQSITMPDVMQSDAFLIPTRLLQQF